MTWDAFICHAQKDKKDFVLPIAVGLQEAGFKIWLDDWCLKVGDSLLQSIGKGLRDSRYGVVVLSHAFFSANWPRREMATLLARESAAARVILPVWYKITDKEVYANEPLLVDHFAARSQEGVHTVVDKLCRVLNLGKVFDEKNAKKLRQLGEIPITRETLTQFTERTFPGKGIDEFFQTRLLADLDKSTFRSIEDIERAVHRAQGAVEAFSRECPTLFKSGTDFITKSLGFVDLCFRTRHNWASATEKAFVKHAARVKWD